MLGLDTAIKNPFPGLRAYSENETDCFFGRERQLDELLRKMRANRFLAIVSNAGSGKSSFVKAGLISKLRKGFTGQGGSKWRIAMCNPGENPIQNLSRKLADKEVLLAEKKMEPNFAAKVEQTLRQGSQGISELFQRSDIGNDENLLIVIDQFEELFRFSGRNSRNFEDASNFVSLLLNAVRQKDMPIYVMFTMRAKYLAQCSDFRGLAEAVNEGQYLLPKLKREELKRAIINFIQHPNAVAYHGANTIIEEDLVNQILNDVGNQTDDLPTLQHCLSRTWDYWVGHAEHDAAPISLKDYKKIGRFKGALSRHAEEAYGELEGDEKRVICERIFRALVEREQDNSLSVRPVTVQELMDITEQTEIRQVRFVIHTFSKEGRNFIIAPPVSEMDTDSLISLGNDSLIRRWGRLKEWINEEEEALHSYERLCVAAGSELNNKGSLWQGAELNLGLKWWKPSEYDKEFSWRLAPNSAWAKRYPQNISYEQAIDFLERSQGSTLATKNRAKVEEENKENKRRTIFLILLLAALVCLGFALWAIYKSNQAEESLRKAQDSNKEARRQQYLSEIAKEEAAEQEFLAKISEERALAEKVIADNATKWAIDEKQNAESALQQANIQKKKAENATEDAREKAKKAKEAENRALKAAKIAKDKTALAEQEKIKSIIIRTISLAQSVAVKSESIENENVQGLLAKEAYELNNVSGGETYDPYIYSAVYNAMNQLQKKVKNNPNFNALNQKPDGISFLGRIRSIAVSPDDQFIYTVGSDGFLLKWKFKTYNNQKERNKNENKPKILIKDQKSVARAIDISSDGETVVLAGDAPEITTYILSKEEVEKRFASHTKNRVWDVKYIENGKGAAVGLISSGSNGRGGTSIKYTSVIDKSTSTLIEVDDLRLTSLDLSSDGKLLAAVGLGKNPEASKEVRIWDITVPNQPELYTIGKSSSAATAVSIGPNKRFIAIGYQNGEIAIYDLLGDKETNKRVFKNHRTKISSLVFSNDGSKLLAGSLDKSASLWSIRNMDVIRNSLGKKVLESDKHPYKNPNFLPIKLRNHDAWVTSVAFSNRGDRFITGCANGEMKIWEVNASLYAEQICSIVNGQLSNETWKKHIGTDDPELERVYIQTKEGEHTPESTCGKKLRIISDSNY